MNAKDGWDNSQATTEGWFLFSPQDGCPSVSAFFESIFFSGISKTVEGERLADAKALAFVQAKAAEGSTYHIDALARIQML